MFYKWSYFIITVLIYSGCSRNSDIDFYKWMNFSAIDSAGFKKTAGGLMYSSCVLNKNGTVDCWGKNSYGQLGNGTFIDSVLPTKVVGVNDAVSIVCGDIYCCVLNIEGDVKCWGATQITANELAGYLGDGDVSVVGKPIPQIVPNLSRVVAISAEDHNTCAILEDRSVKCWGSNFKSTSGILPYTGPLYTATKVDDLENVKKLHTGHRGGCVILFDQTVKCWGRNVYGNVTADGTFADVGLAPQVIAGLTDVSDIVAGEKFICALKNNNSVTCWGSAPFFGLPGSVITPTNIINFLGATKLSTGFNHVCALIGNFTVKCMGNNTYGQLGNGNNLPQTSPVDVIGLPVGQKIIDVVCKDEGTCVQLDNGEYWCWGRNTQGSIGNADVITPSFNTPQKVTVY